ncbi:endolytic transglycosylase MltG [Candidatus Latescibacterota bacterium]
MKIFTPKKTLATLIAISVIVIIIVVYRWLNSVYLPECGEDSFTVQINVGMTAKEIGEMLHREGIIRSTYCFTVVSSLHGLSRKFKAGDHLLKGNMSVVELAQLLTQNPLPPPDIVVTVIEGLAIHEIASVLATKAGIDSAAFMAHAMDKYTTKKLGVDNDTLEGYLYPDTYFILPETKPLELITKMVEQFNFVYDDSLRKRTEEIGMTVNEVVTLASIIESEVSIDDERSLVSSVFHRRLKRNRPLEANATVQYAIGSKRRVLNDDLKIQSLYNTYIHKGLPPGPIANPGKKSLHAALFPAETKYLYFVADGNGGHVFSRTLAEHSRAVRRYKKTRYRSHVQ